MTCDAQGLQLAAATAEAAASYDRAVRAFTLAYGDPLAEIDTALAAAPACAMAHVAKAWMFALANDAALAARARPMLAQIAALATSDRERTHLAALTHAVEGHRASATSILDRYLMDAPCDLLAHYAAMLLDAFQGRFAWVANRSARALPLWSSGQPGYGILLSFHGFGLEECGDYARAEAVARDAAEREPHGYWPHHAVSHVMEMTGRPGDGLAWMASREPLWSGRLNANRVHIWWHKALFHIELGQFDAAMRIYDGPVVESQRPLGISLTNATALLWRLEMLGFEGGHRWSELAALWEGHADGRICLFADVHAAMTAIGAGRTADLDRLLQAMRATAAGSSEVAPAYRLIGLPVVQGLAAFRAGAYSEAVAHLLPARYDLWRLGGSHAQRDIVEWTLTEAAVRAGDRAVAVSLAHERLSARPLSAPNQRFLRQAEAIAH